MAGLVEKVTDSHDADGFPREIHRQARGASGKHTRNRVQFLAAVAQIVSGYDKIGGGKRRTRRKQNRILTVPKSVAV